MSILREQTIEMLKKGWISNYEAQRYLKSSSADRWIRFVRNNPPAGWVVVQRRKDLTDKYNRCLEYKLIRGKTDTKTWQEVFAELKKMVGVKWQRENLQKKNA